MKYIISLLTIVVLMSCNQGKIENLQSELEQVKAQNDLIRQQSSAKDQFVDEYTHTLNDVYDNLENIRKREGLLTQHSKDLEIKNKNNIRNKVLNDIESINSYIENSKGKLASLRKKYSESDLKIKSFEETVDKLTKELQEKEVAIADLRAEVDNLTSKVSMAQLAIQQKDSLIDEQTGMMNTAYFIIGSDEELEQKHIITRKGGLFGFGKTTVVAPDLQSDEFSSTNITQTDKIKIPSNIDDLEIVSAHNPDSYSLVKTGDNETELEIKNPAEFWKMRYLVILTKG